MTRTTEDAEELQGSEFARVHLLIPDVEVDTFWQDVQRLRHARTAMNVAKQLGRLLEGLGAP